MSIEDDYVDPFEAHFRRDPMTGAGIRVIAIAGDHTEKALAVASQLVETIKGRSREAEFVVVEPWDGRALAMERGLVGLKLPLVIVTSATEVWTAEHLDPLLKAIDACDHVVGRRRIGLVAKIRRWIVSRWWRFLFAIPSVDVQSPCRLHRAEKLREIVPQSVSSFLDVEILAKATFLGHLIDEVPVPALEASRSWGAWDDFLAVFKHPRFRREPVAASAPAEEPKGQQEGPEGPGREDGQGEPDDVVGDHGPLQDHGPQGVQ